MHPNHRLALSLLVSLALWAPTFRSTVDGNVDILAASIRWVAAFVVASISTSILANLLHAYRPVEPADVLDDGEVPATIAD